MRQGETGSLMWEGEAGSAVWEGNAGSVMGKGEARSVKWEGKAGSVMGKGRLGVRWVRGGCDESRVALMTSVHAQEPACFFVLPFLLLFEMNRSVETRRPAQRKPKGNRSPPDIYIADRRKRGLALSSNVCRLNGESHEREMEFGW